MKIHLHVNFFIKSHILGEGLKQTIKCGQQRGWIPSSWLGIQQDVQSHLI